MTLYLDVYYLRDGTVIRGAQAYPPDLVVSLDFLMEILDDTTAFSFAQEGGGYVIVRPSDVSRIELVEVTE